uniref:Cleavage and polyadenylation specificity factor subunit 2 n=1 Tax=Eptatretus burgeri TaxID=7764 RepID=A0A8C4N487_EPTBU
MQSSLWRQDILLGALEMQKEESEPLELRVSWVKTKIQTFNDILDTAILSVPVCGEDVQVVERFTYLGRDIHVSAGCKSEVNRRLGWVIIVHGSADATQHLTEACRAIGGKDIKVFVPRLYETVDATSENLIYQVRLKDSLVSSLTFRRARDGELAWVDGQLDIRANTSFLATEEAIIEGTMAIANVTTTQDKEKSLNGGVTSKDIGADAEIIPTLEPLSPSKLVGHQAVFVNEPRLSDFKQVLLREGIQAEFIGGVLVCNSVLAVRRVSVTCAPLPSLL